MMPAGARFNTLTSQNTNQISASRLEEAITQGQKNAFAEERLRELWLAGTEMMSGGNRLRNANIAQPAEHGAEKKTGKRDKAKADRAGKQDAVLVEGSQVRLGEVVWTAVVLDVQMITWRMSDV